MIFPCSIHSRIVLCEFDCLLVIFMDVLFYLFTPPEMKNGRKGADGQSTEISESHATTILISLVGVL